MTTFNSDIDQIRSALARIRPGGKGDIYALPWYLVVGEPETGKSAAIKAIGLTFPHGDPIRSANLTSWIAGEAARQQEAGFSAAATDPSRRRQ